MNSCLHGSEGAGTQQCVPATRLIVGRGSRSAIATLVCRTSRYLRLVHLPHGHAAPAVAEALAACFGLLLPAPARLTLTWDQGSQMAHHDRIALHLADGVFFAYPGAPWLRGTNENTNGLLRQYFPKGTDLSIHSADDLRGVEDRLNHRPRKTLGWAPRQTSSPPRWHHDPPTTLRR